MRLTGLTRSAIRILRSRQSRRRSSSSGVGALTIAHTRGSPRLYASSVRSSASPVKPYVRRQKNDAADAAGICEAVTRPSMRFTGVRTLENQAALMHHKARELLVAQRTQLINALRGHLAEIGVIAAQGLKNARELARVILVEDDETIPACVRAALAPLVRQLHALDQEIARSDRTIAAMARDDEMARRLMTIPGLGPVTALA